MYYLNPENLRPCDIILVMREEDRGGVIAERTQARYPHAILYGGHYSCLEADAYGVASQNILRIFFQNKEDAIVLRSKQPLSEATRESIIAFARERVGTSFASKFELAKVLIEKREKFESLKKNSQFCTRLVAQTYAYVGISIVEDPNYCSPIDIEKSETLEVVDVELFFIDDEKVEEIQNNDTIKNQAFITGRIMEDVRNITGTNLQTFSEIIPYLENNPSMDIGITKIVQESGYLDLWKKHKSSSPHSYDYNLFKIKHPSPNEQIVNAFWLISAVPYDRYIQNKHIYAYLSREYPNSAFFKSQLDLYDKLVEIDDTRKQIGFTILEEYKGILNTDQQMRLSFIKEQRNRIEHPNTYFKSIIGIEHGNNKFAEVLTGFLHQDFTPDNLDDLMEQQREKLSHLFYLNDEGIPKFEIQTRWDLFTVLDFDEDEIGLRNFLGFFVIVDLDENTYKYILSKNIGEGDIILAQVTSKTTARGITETWTFLNIYKM